MDPLAVLSCRFRSIQTHFERLCEDVFAGHSSALEPLESKLDGSFKLAFGLVDQIEPSHNVTKIANVFFLQQRSAEQLDRMDGFVFDALGDGKMPVGDTTL
jgi:hypothetical protein